MAECGFVKRSAQNPQNNSISILVKPRSVKHPGQIFRRQGAWSPGRKPKGGPVFRHAAPLFPPIDGP